VIKEFREFIARGNVIDLAVAVVIGAAFGRIVTSLVDGIMMPPLGLWPRTSIGPSPMLIMIVVKRSSVCPGRAVVSMLKLRM